MGSEVVSEPLTQNWIFQRIFHAGLNKTDFVSCIVVPAFEAVAVDRHLAGTCGERIGQLQLTTEAGPQVGNVRENGRLQDVTSEDAETRPHILGLGPLRKGNHLQHAGRTAGVGFGDYIEYPEALDLR